MTFDELKEKINAANHAVEDCEKAKKDIPAKLAEVRVLMDNALGEISKARLGNLAEEGDSTAVLEAKAARMFEGLKNARKEQIKASKVQTDIDDFLTDILAEQINTAAQEVFVYNTFRKELKATMIQTKVEIAIGVNQLKKYLKSIANDSTLALVDEFLAELQQLNFYEITKADVKKVMKAFREMTERFWFSDTDTNKVRRGSKKEYKNNLEDLLDKGVEYAKNAAAVWEACETIRTKLDNNKYVLAIRQELGVKDAEEYRKWAIQNLEIKEEEIKEMMLEMSPNKVAGMIEELEAIVVPDAIDWLKVTYNLSTWVYTEYGEQAGQSMNLEQEASFKFSITTPPLEADVSIPVFEAVFASLTFDFGASLSATANFGGALKLHNFLSANETKYVSGNLEADASVDANAFAGLGLQLLKVVRASGRVVLTGSASIKAAAPVELEKAKIDKIAMFRAAASNDIAILLNGKLQAVVGLTAPFKIIVKALTGKDAEAKFDSPTLDFFKATRSDKVQFEMPFRKRPTTFPENALSVKKGKWDVDFIAKAQIDALINSYFGGAKDFEAKMKENPLTEVEKESLLEIYGVFGTEKTA